MPPRSRLRPAPHLYSYLTYFERTENITEALVDEGVKRGEFGFMPFPVETPEILPDFLPTSVICFTTVYEPWNREKIRRLEAQGYTVEVLWERAEKAYQGGVIRAQMMAGDDAWKDAVPAASIRAAERYHLRERLLNLAGSA